MGPDDSIELTPELLNDFYAECEEHLATIRQSLVVLEGGAAERTAVAHIEKLFRSFHSLKGIVAMAGIRSAEELCHGVEDYLRAVSREHSQLTPEGLDLIVNAVTWLEQTVSAFRDKQPMPDAKPIIEQFGTLLALKPAAEEDPAPPPKSADPVQDKIQEAQTQGFAVWKAVFIPTPDLNSRGINVNEIRKRLGAVGDIIHASPKVKPGGGIVFEFLLAAHDPPGSAADWDQNGVSVEQIAEPIARKPEAPRSLPSASVAVAPSQLIRVELRRLDDLMRIAGELVIQRARLEEQINRLDAGATCDVRGLQEVNVGFARNARDLRETVMRLRMVPIAEIFDRIPFVVRDLTRGSEKKIKIEVRGQMTELDKYVVERLKEPLLHLVRNAVSHGVEDAQERTQRGKPAEATLTLSASTAGETVIIQIADDGRGIDRKQIAKRASEMELPLPDTLDDAAILELISMPGFSTREEADRASGRGVGMAVVANTVRELGGSWFLQTDPGKGTRFTLRLPLTLLITDALIVSSGDQSFAIPQNSVDEVVQIEESKVKRMERAELLSLRGTVLPLLRLRSVFGYPPATHPTPPVLISHSDRGRIGLVVDRVIGQRQIVVRSLRDPLIHVPGVIGATELGDGKPLLILDAAGLARDTGSKRMTTELAPGKGEAQ